MIKFLQTVRILDKDGVVSLTNIIVYATIVYSLWFTINPFLIVSTIALYGLGRWINFKRGQAVDLVVKQILANQESLRKQVNDNKNNLSSLHIKAGIKSQSGITKLRTF